MTLGDDARHDTEGFDLQKEKRSPTATVRNLLGPNCKTA
jgi:hypothetical protein